MVGLAKRPALGRGAPAVVALLAVLAAWLLFAGEAWAQGEEPRPENPNEQWQQEGQVDGPIGPGDPAPEPPGTAVTSTVGTALRSASPDTLFLAQSSVPAGARISNGTVAMGVHDLGHLNYSGTGVRYEPSGADGLIPGCPCEGWGIADAVTKDTGYANKAMGTRGLTAESFESDGETAKSVVKAGKSFRVTHRFQPSSNTDHLYAITVTVENISDERLKDVRYRRVMDWDVPPQVFYEYVSNHADNYAKGSAPVLFMSDNGFASANPLSGESSLRREGEMLNGGPGDIGGLFDFGLGEIGPGESKSFMLYYGVGPDEATTKGALEAVGAEAYSLGKPSRALAKGDPNTFGFGFKQLADPDPGADKPSYVAIGDSMTTGHGIDSCGLPPAPGFEFEHGCPRDKSYIGGARPYPEIIAETLGEPYTDLDRVGVYGYTAEDAFAEYDWANKNGTDRRRDGTGLMSSVTPWKSQLHAVDEAEDLVTMHLGVNDVGFTDPLLWVQAGLEPKDIITEVEGKLGEQKAKEGLDVVYARLADAKSRGARVVVATYHNPMAAGVERCETLFGAGMAFVGPLNAETINRTTDNGLTLANVFGAFVNGANNHGGGGPEPWVFATGCQLEDTTNEREPGEPDTITGEEDPAGPKVIDPHPNAEGDEKIAEEFVRAIREEQ